MAIKITVEENPTTDSTRLTVVIEKRCSECGHSRRVQATWRDFPFSEASLIMERTVVVSILRELADAVAWEGIGDT